MRGVVHIDFILALSLFSVALVLYVSTVFSTLPPPIEESERAKLKAMASSITDLLLNSAGNPFTWDNLTIQLNTTLSEVFRLGLAYYSQPELAHSGGRSPPVISLSKLLHLNLEAAKWAKEHTSYANRPHYIPYSTEEFYSIVPDPDASTEWQKYILDGRLVSAKKSLDLTQYDFLIIVEPIWNHSIAADFKLINQRPMSYGGQLPKDRTVLSTHRIVLIKLDLPDPVGAAFTANYLDLKNGYILAKVTVYVWRR